MAAALSKAMINDYAVIELLRDNLIRCYPIWALSGEYIYSHSCHRGVVSTWLAGTN